MKRCGLLPGRPMAGTQRPERYSSTGAVPGGAPDRNTLRPSCPPTDGGVELSSIVSRGPSLEDGHGGVPDDDMRGIRRKDYDGMRR